MINNQVDKNVIKNRYNRLLLDERMLKELIIKLENYNSVIIDSLSDIYNIMNKLDLNDWESPEKKEIDNNFIPFIRMQISTLNNNLDNRINFLKKIVVIYHNENMKLKNMIDKMEEF